MRRLYIGVLALLRIDAATIAAVRRTANVAVFGAANASQAQHYAATFASLRCGGLADRFIFLDEPAPASAVALAAIGVHVVIAEESVAPAALVFTRRRGGSRLEASGFSDGSSNKAEASGAEAFQSPDGAAPPPRGTAKTIGGSISSAGAPLTLRSTIVRAPPPPKACRSAATSRGATVTSAPTAREPSARASARS